MKLFSFLKLIILIENPNCNLCTRLCLVSQFSSVLLGYGEASVVFVDFNNDMNININKHTHIYMHINTFLHEVHIKRFFIM